MISFEYVDFGQRLYFLLPRQLVIRKSKYSLENKEYVETFLRKALFCCCYLTQCTVNTTEQLLGSTEKGLLCFSPQLVSLEYQLVVAYLEATTTLWLLFALLKGRRQAALCTNVWYFVQKYLQAILKSILYAGHYKPRFVYNPLFEGQERYSINALLYTYLLDTIKGLCIMLGMKA